jgi:CO/xanthine dehydrogenase Mo-binding subunit
VASASKKLAANLKAIASHELEAAESDLEIANGEVRIAGTDRTLPVAKVAASARAKPDLLSVKDMKRWGRLNPRCALQTIGATKQLIVDKNSNGSMIIVCPGYFTEVLVIIVDSGKETLVERDFADQVQF